MLLRQRFATHCMLPHGSRSPFQHTQVSTHSSTSCCCRYYAQQRAADAISSNMVKDELKRHSRINRQLAEEQRVMEELYKV